MGWLMVWGTSLLLIDGIAIVLLYEQLGKWLRSNLFLRVVLSAMCILSFDQLGFFLVLHALYGAPVAVLTAGWMAKMIAAVFYSTLIIAYLRLVEERPAGARARISDVFDLLTYREKYEALLVRSSRDGLTGVLNRDQFDRAGPQIAAASGRSGKPLSLIALDIDLFKTLNDRLGHGGGDAVLKLVAATIVEGLRSSDQVYRYGGDEFVIVCPDTPHAATMLLIERLRAAVLLRSAASDSGKVTISAGVATTLGPDYDLAALFGVADARLYAAKNAGRDRAVGEAGSRHGNQAVATLRA